jgi:pimeloyl-ACP methyl ester carboxylesterase
MRGLVALVALWSSATPASAADGGDATPAVRLVEHTTAIAYQREFPSAARDAWRQRVPKVQLVRIKSSLDGNQQRAYWYDSGARARRPLLVVLHSWSADFTQNLDIPFAELAILNDWAFVHPDFRGRNNRPQATSSKAAVQDIVDAVAYAKEHASIDPDRVYLVGYSGGAMAALVLAGRHPELWAGVAVWGAVFDLPDWYRHAKHQGEDHYEQTISASCRGAPVPGSAAERDCRERSPATYLGAAAGRVPILLAHGLKDKTVPPRHSLVAYDALAAPSDHFTDEQRAFIDSKGEIPDDLRQLTKVSEPSFERAGLAVKLKRQSRSVTLMLYEGGHDMAYNAAFQWLSEQRRQTAAARR